MLPQSDQWTFRVAHYTPWLFYWWMTQKWFPSLSFTNIEMFPSVDVEILKSLSESPDTGQVSILLLIVSLLVYLIMMLFIYQVFLNIQEKITQQGEYESLHRDIIAGFGKWEFGLTEISNPFPENDGTVHIWQGFKDRIIPYTLNRYISHKLPWIHYHELPYGGHLFIFKKNHCESIIRALIHS